MTTIEQIRQKHHLSQEAFAEIVGVSRPTAIKICDGSREIRLSEAKRLSEALEIDLDSILGKKPTISHQVVIQKKKPTPEQTSMRISVPQKNFEKFKNALLYITQKIGASPNVGQSVLYKILYFCDFDYYEKFEEQLIGATYIKNHFGPTPVEFRKIVDDMIKNGEIEEVKTKHFKYEQTKYLPVFLPNLAIFSAQEIKHIDEEIERLGKKTAKELSDLSHGDVPWITTAEGKVIEYEAVFYRTAETSMRTYEPTDL